MIALSLGVSAILLMIGKLCESKVTEHFPIEKCDSSQICVKFVSSYIIECKYNHDFEFVPWLLYASVLMTVFLLDFIAYKITESNQQLNALCLLLSIISVVGITLVFYFDSRVMRGAYDTIYFKGYGFDNSFWHGAGVLLLFTSNVFIHLIIILIYQNNLLTGTPKKKLWKTVFIVDQEIDVIYTSVVVLFFVFFLMDNIAVATVLEYVTVALFALATFMSVLIYEQIV